MGVSIVSTARTGASGGFFDNIFNTLNSGLSTWERYKEIEDNRTNSNGYDYLQLAEQAGNEVTFDPAVPTGASTGINQNYLLIGGLGFAALILILLVARK